MKQHGLFWELCQDANYTHAGEADDEAGEIN